MPYPLLHEERHAWRWLMHELSAELGVTFHKGRRQALDRLTQLRIRARMAQVPRRKRMAAYQYEATLHRVSRQTIQRIVLQQYG